LLVAALIALNSAALGFIARITRLIITATTVVALIAARSTTASIATTLVAVSAILTLTHVGLWFLGLDGLAAEQAFEPAEESAGRFGGFWSTALYNVARLGGALFERRFSTRFAGRVGFRLARLKRF
jgi:hypothetical protein